MKKALLGIVLVLVVGLGWGVYTLNEACACGKQGELLLTVNEETTLSTLTGQLEEEGFLPHPNLFRAWATVRGASSPIQGTYRIPQAASMADIVNVLRAYPQREGVRITLIEGRTNEQIAEVVSESLFLSQEELEAEFKRVDYYAESYAFLEGIPEGRTLEGFLFPDTYEFFTDATAETVVRTLLDTFDLRTREIQDELIAEYDSVFRAVNLASIVQLESGAASDNAAIARVFRNRLEIGQPLQSDVTINYVTQQNNQIATLEETRVDSPYNTYLQPGLPFGPVSNPGLAALQSVIDAEDHDYLFFLTDLTTGKAYFAETLAGHEQNIERYLR